MGACCGNTQTIDFQFDEPDHQYEHHILLLGTAHSGKTTLLKQMRKIHGPYPSTNGSTHSLIHGYIHQSSAMIPEEIYGVIQLFYADRLIDVGFETIIRERIVNYMKILCTQSIKLGIDIDERNIAFQHFFANQLNFPFTADCNAENGEKMKKLWADDGIKETLKRRREYDIADNVEYFMDQRIDDIVSTDYVVTFGDFLRIGMRTTGYMREIFKKSIYGTEHQFIFTDVAGSRPERSEWIHMSHDHVDAVIYVIAISEFDLLLQRDQVTPRLDEALDLFKTILSKGFCHGKIVTLFFNKYDLFDQKLRDPTAKTIADIYPDDFPQDKDPRNPDDVCQYIYDKFLALYKEYEPEADNYPHCHRTTALDTDQIECLMQDIEGDFVRARLCHVS